MINCVALFICAQAAMSGVNVSSDIVPLWEDVKKNKTHKWVTFKLSKDQKQIEIDHKAEPLDTEDKDQDKAEFENLKEKLLQPNEKGKVEPRYVIYDFKFSNDEGRVFNKLAFICW